MLNPILINLAALTALIPAAVVSFRPRAGRDRVFWASMALAVAGSGAWAAAQVADSWHTGLSATLWVSVAVSAGLFAGLAAVTRQGWRLAPLLMPYLIVLASFAAMFSSAPERPLAAAVPMVWLEAHIVVSVVTYALLTMAAVASLAAFLQERALKQKRPTGLTRLLPALTDSESLSVRLLAACETVLGLGLVTGLATRYMETGSLWMLDHKALLSLAAFVVIGALLTAQRLVGMRGRMAARIILLAYLLLTLAYPGVKFVTNVLLA